jgi:hypothetical protein
MSRITRLDAIVSHGLAKTTGSKLKRNGIRQQQATKRYTSAGELADRQWHTNEHGSVPCKFSL